MNTLNITNPLNAEPQQNADQLQEEMVASNVNEIGAKEEDTKVKEVWKLFPYKVRDPDPDFLRFPSVACRADDDRMLVISAKTPSRIGTEEELNDVRALVLEVEKNDSVLRVYQYGIVEDEWVIALLFCRQQKLNDDDLLIFGFKHIHEQLLKSAAMRSAFHPSRTPFWTYQIGGTSVQMGGLFLKETAN